MDKLPRNCEKAKHICFDSCNYKARTFSISTTEEIFADMHNAKYFSKIDANNGFWQIRVDKDNSKLPTFNIHLGRYRFTRQP